MIEDAIDREVEAVDSGESATSWCAPVLQYCSSTHVLVVAEYQLARPSDSHRKEMLFGSLARAGHPMAKFFWGETHTHTRAHTHCGVRDL